MSNFRNKTTSETEAEKQKTPQTTSEELPLLKGHSKQLNVIQLGFGFFALFVAFNSQGFIQEAVFNSVGESKGINRHAGYYGLSLYYGVFTIANLFIAPLIDCLGPRAAMVIGAVLTVIYQVGFLDLTEWYFYATSAAAGIGAALLWPAQGTYMTQNSEDDTIEENSSILWAMSQASQIAGGIILLFVFHGASDYGQQFSDTSLLWTTISFTVVLFIGICIFATLRKVPSVSLSKTDPISPSIMDKLLSTVRLMSKKRMLLLATVFSYTGIVQSFWTSIYPTCISFTRELGENTNALVAYSSILSGFGQVTVCIYVAYTKMHRRSIVVLGCICHLAVFISVFINFPPDASLQSTGDYGFIKPNWLMAIATSFVLGFGDGCWNTEVYSIIADVYPNQSSEAFAVFNFYQSLWTSMSLYYSSHITLYIHLIILSSTCIAGAICYFIVDRMGRIENIPERSNKGCLSRIYYDFIDEYLIPRPKPVGPFFSKKMKLRMDLDLNREEFLNFCKNNQLLYLSCSENRPELFCDEVFCAIVERMEFNFSTTLQFSTVYNELSLSDRFLEAIACDRR